MNFIYTDTLDEDNADTGALYMAADKYDIKVHLKLLRQQIIIVTKFWAKTV